MKCPICDSELKYTSMSESIGLVESQEECTFCRLFFKNFAYGQTEFNIGDCIVSYDYHMEKEQAQMERINSVVDLLCKFYKEGFNQ